VEKSKSQCDSGKQCAFFLFLLLAFSVGWLRGPCCHSTAVIFCSKGGWTWVGSEVTAVKP
jgi:hypothetical protein